MIKTLAGPSVKSALPFHFCLAQHHLLARIQVSIITRTCQIIFTVSDFANIERFPNCPNILCYEDPPDPLYRIPSTTPFIEFPPLLIEKIVLLCILHQLSHIWGNEKPPPKWIRKYCFFSFQRHHRLPKPGQQRPSSNVIFSYKWKTKSWKQCDSEQPVKTLVVILQNSKNKIRAIVFMKWNQTLKIVLQKEKFLTNETDNHRRCKLF